MRRSEIEEEYTDDPVAEACLRVLYTEGRSHAVAGLIGWRTHILFLHWRSNPRSVYFSFSSA